MSQAGIGKRTRATRAHTRQQASRPDTKRFVLIPADFCHNQPCNEVSRIAPALTNASYGLVRTRYDLDEIDNFIEDMRERIDAGRSALIEAFELVIVVPLGYAKTFADQVVAALAELIDVALNLVVVQEAQS